MRYDGLRPASRRASAAARGASRKRDTRPELLLRRALWRAGIRGYRVAARDLPGRPDIVIPRARLAIFCDGDFWHGKDLAQRIARLERGHNAPYWIAKIEGNVRRDRRHDEALRALGWHVLRFWESAIARELDGVVAAVRAALVRPAPPGGA